MIASHRLVHEFDQWSVGESGRPGLISFDADANRRPVFHFGQFTVAPKARSILRDGRRVSLGSRAFDLLVVLLNSRGSVVSKLEIINYVWPSTVVEDSNLRYQVTSLRKAVGADAIVTIPGRGYFFAAETVVEWLAAPSLPRTHALMHGFDA